MRQQPILSAANAIIYIADHRVGHLQNLTIKENYNLQPIKSLFHDEITSFVPGIKEFQATASKGFIEYESILGTIQEISHILQEVRDLAGITQKSSAAGSIIDSFTQGIIDFSSSIDSSVESVKSWTGTKTDPTNAAEYVLDLAKNILNGTISLGEVFSKITFDIRVKNPVISADVLGMSNLPSAYAGIDMWILTGCQLNTRNIEISTGNVVVMENVSILAKSNRDKSVSNVTAGFIPFV